MLLALTWLGCTSTPGTETEPEPEPELEPICNGGTQWSAGAPAFADATDAWGLVGVEGVRLSAVDFDGDGYPDLVVRRGDNLADDFFEGPACCEDRSCTGDEVCPVRRTWLLRNTGAGTFEDVTVASRIVARRDGDTMRGRPGTVYAFADVDNDGDLDVYTGLPPVQDVIDASTSELLLNAGDGTFALQPDSSEPGNDLRASGAPAGASFADLDNNGAVDLFVAHGGDPRPDRVYLGDGTGLFYDYTSAVGTQTLGWLDEDVISRAEAHSRAWASAACDVNGDGFVDLLAASYGRSPNHLWLSGGAGDPVGFTNHSVASGYAFDHRTDWSDNESARCYCTLNPSAPDCAGVPAPTLIACNSNADAFRWNHPTDRSPYRLGGNSGTTVCADVDNDGDIDLLTTEIVHWDVGSSSDPSELLFNDGSGVFSRPGNEVTGLVREHEMVDWNDGDITAAVFDFDNDGWPDVYIGSTDYPGARGLLYHQVSPGVFESVPLADGIDHTRSHGVAVADFDRDGDLDMVVGHSRARCGGSTDCYERPQVRLFENASAPGNWVQIELEGGPGTNRAAIGARVTLTTPDGVTRTQEVGGGHGHYGMQHDLTLHFGLGAACEGELTVRWPDASLTTQTVKVVSGYRFRLVQGDDKPTAQLLEEE